MQKLFPENAIILILGDSILAQENWSKWLGRLDISNQAYGGAITQQIRWNIGKGFPEKTKLVILNGGINDLFSGVPVEHILENYAFLFSSPRSSLSDLSLITAYIPKIRQKSIKRLKCSMKVY
jgi:lysophospholipase L1-like esterase